VRSSIPSYFTVLLGFAPLPAPLVTALRHVEVESSVGQASSFRLHFALSRNFLGDFDALALPIFRPLVPVTVMVSLGLGIPQVLINGYLQDMRLSASNQPGGSTLEIVGSDALGTRMATIEQPMPWPNLSEGNIAQVLYSRNAILAPPTHVEPLPPTRTQLDTTTTQRLSDAQTLFALARPLGFQVHILPGPAAGVDIGVFRRPPPVLVPQAVLSIDFGSQTNLADLNVSYDMLRPTSVVGVSSDPRTRVPVPVTAPVSSDLPLGLEPTLNRILPPTIERFGAAHAAVNPAEAQLHALARASETSRSIRVDGAVDGAKFNRVLLPGMPVAIRGAGREHSGLYMVESVSHKITRDAYDQRFSGWRNAVGLTGAELFVDPLAAVA
jgi:hypothetical protein